MDCSLLELVTGLVRSEEKRSDGIAILTEEKKETGSMKNRVTCTRQEWRVEGKASQSKKEHPHSRTLFSCLELVTGLEPATC